MVERTLSAHAEMFTPDAGKNIGSFYSPQKHGRLLDLAESGTLRRRAGRQQGPASEASRT
jgi:hypothetical protein